MRLLRKTSLVSLLILAILVGLLAVRQAHTSAELLPLASAVGWVEGNGRGLGPELIGAGVRPAHVVRIGTSYIPRTPPAMMLFCGGVCKVYRSIAGRPLDGADLPKLVWWINFLGVLPWALLLFGGLGRLAMLWGGDEGAQPEWASWAAIAGTMGFGWFGVASVYLPVAAIACWVVALVLESLISASPGGMILAGLAAGFAGAAHPTGWIWVVWGLFVRFVASPRGYQPSRNGIQVAAFGISAALAILITLVGNHLFFGTPLPVQWIDLQPFDLSTDRMMLLLWHDLIGWNGLVWLAPLVPVGLARMGSAPEDLVGGQFVVFVFGLVAVTLFIWGLADDSRLVDEIEQVPPEIRVLPVELVGGEFEMVQLGSSGDTPDERRAFYERLVERTDVFLYTGGRSPGLPVFLPIGLMLGLMGWCWIVSSRFWGAWSWIGVRWGGLVGLVMSQAPYGSVADLFTYAGLLPSNGHVPILESLLAVCIRLAEFWPSAMISF